MEIKMKLLAGWKPGNFSLSIINFWGHPQELKDCKDKEL